MITIEYRLAHQIIDGGDCLETCTVDELLDEPGTAVIDEEEEESYRQELDFDKN